MIAAVIRVRTGNGSNPEAKAATYVQANVTNTAVAYICIAKGLATKGTNYIQVHMYVG